MRSEPASVWFVPAEGTDTHAILIKSPTNVLKAIIKKCPLSFVFGIKENEDQRILSTAMKIYDDLASPLILSGVQRYEEEHFALKEILQRESTPIFLFDELNRCVAWAEAKLNFEEAQSAIKLLKSPKSLYSGDFNKETSYALDCLDYSIDQSRSIEGATLIDIISVDVSVGEFHTIKIHAVSIRETHAFNIDDSNEGAGLEQSAWHLLESMFPLQIYKSPQVEDGKIRAS